MSKKMMKRSLALGALMAFVITGSAMAAEVGLAVEPSQTFTTDTIGDYKGEGKTKADGVRARYSTIILNNGATISAEISDYVDSSDDGAAYGVRALSDPGKTSATITFGGDTTTISAKGNYAWGVMVSGGENSKIALDSKNTQVDVTYGGSDYKGQLTGIQAQYGSLVSSAADSNLVINVTAGNDVGNNLHAMGIVAMPRENIAGKIDLKGNLNATVVNNGAGEANGINANEGGTVNLADATITAKANTNASYGAFVYDASELNSTGNMIINASSNDNAAHGVYAEKDADIRLADINITATSSGKDVKGTDKKEATTTGITGHDSSIQVSGTANITATAKGTLARAVNLSSTAANTVRFDGETTLTAVGLHAQGVFVSGSADAAVTFNDKTTITADGTNEVFGIFVQNGGKAVATDSVTINTHSERGESVGIFNWENTANDITGNGGGIIELTGDVTINATATDFENAYAVQNWTGAGTTTIGSTTSKVIMEGNILAYDGTVTAILGTEDSYLTGSVRKDYIDSDKAKEGASVTLGLNNGATWNVTGESYVDALTGNKGTIVLSETTANFVTVDNNQNKDITVSGTKELTDAIATGKISKEDAMENLQKAAVNNEGKSIAKTLTTQESDVAGAYTTTVNADGTLGTIQEATNTRNKALSEAGVNLKAHWRAHMNDMNKRMGELRNANGEAGVWARMVRGEAEYESTKAQYNQYQLGYDQKTGDWVVGVAVTYAEGDSNYAYGSTEDDSTAFAIYGSKLNKDGSFIDLIARYANIDSELDDALGKADYDTDGYSISAEYGKRFKQNDGLWIEPQVELTYGTIDSASYKLGSKTVTMGDMDSIIGRVGFSIGKDIEQGNIYARASYLYDFDGESTNTFTANGITRPIEEDLGGGWWEVGVGANINLSKATYIYADVEKTFGGEVDTNWQWNLGVRYSF